MAYPTDVRNIADLYNVFRDAPNREGLITDIRNGLVRLKNVSKLLSESEIRNAAAISNITSMLSSLALGMEKVSKSLATLSTTDINRAEVLSSYQSTILKIEASTLAVSRYIKNLSVSLSGFVIGGIYSVCPIPAFLDVEPVIPNAFQKKPNTFDDKHDVYVALHCSASNLVSDLYKDSIVVYTYAGVTLFTAIYAAETDALTITTLGGIVFSYNLNLDTDQPNGDLFSPLVIYLVYSKNQNYAQVYAIDSTRIQKFIRYASDYTNRLTIEDVSISLGKVNGDVRSVEHSITQVPLLDVRFSSTPTGISNGSFICMMFNCGLIEMLKFITETETVELKYAYQKVVQDAYTKSDVMLASLLSMQSSISALQAATPQLTEDVLTFPSSVAQTCGSLLNLTNTFSTSSVINSDVKQWNIMEQDGAERKDLDGELPTTLSAVNLATSTFHDYVVNVQCTGATQQRSMSMSISIPKMLDPSTVLSSSLYTDDSNTIIPYSYAKPPNYPATLTQNARYSVSPLAHVMNNDVMPIKNGAVECLKLNTNLNILLTMEIDISDASSSLGGSVHNDFTFMIKQAGGSPLTYSTAFKPVIFTNTDGTRKLKLISVVDLTTLMPADAIYYTLEVAPDAKYVTGADVKMEDTDRGTFTTYTQGNYSYTTTVAIWDVVDYIITRRGNVVYTPPKADYTNVDNKAALITNYKTPFNYFVICDERIYYNGKSLTFVLTAGQTLSYNYFTSPLQNPTVDTYDAGVARNASYLVKMAMQMSSVTQLLSSLTLRVEAMERVMQPSRAQQIAGIVSGVGGLISLAMPLLGAVVVTIGTLISIADPTKQGIDYQSVFNAFTAWCQFAIVARYKYGIMTLNDPKLDTLRFLPKSSIDNFREKPIKIELDGLDETILRGSSTDYIDTGVNIRYNDMQLFGDSKVTAWLNGAVARTMDNTASFFERNVINTLRNKNLLPMHARVEVIQTEKVGDIYRQTILYAGINEGAFIEGDAYAFRSGGSNSYRFNDYVSGPGRFKAVLESTTEDGTFKAADWSKSGMTQKEIFTVAGEMYPSKTPTNQETQDLYEAIIRDFATTDDSFVLQHHNTMMLPGQLDALEKLLIDNAQNFSYAFVGNNCQNYAEDLVNIITNFKRPQGWVSEASFKQYIQSIYDDL
ncbi:RNA-binding protein [Homalodisca vitripennis reovirus]|uniref:RNA-binding protein n=1 Tax=Homalodisca vitripennis reovirus TaxID=411854 RepID=UPI00019977ED|nr:RNA-binding protein [Homalodisca vitripennis reovirus]ACO37233.1 RNA-binding protein [Homalodisca vitripennis reovirus]ADN64802.1 RNA binding protein [Homalodisca vitripennis reovirus]ADN64805.1 RNA binding protein [Homalodisca vitripennis reovirus]